MSNIHTLSQHALFVEHIPLDTQGSANGSWYAPFASERTSPSYIGDTVHIRLIPGQTIPDDVDMKITQAKDASGTDAKDITNAAISTITTATGRKIRSVEFTAGALDDKNGYKFIRAEVTVASGTLEYTVEMIVNRMRQPGLFNQPDVYDEQVVVV